MRHLHPERQLLLVALLALALYGPSVKADGCEFDMIESYDVIAGDTDWHHETWAWVCSTDSSVGTTDSSGGTAVSGPSLPAPTVSIVSLDDTEASNLQITVVGNDSVSSAEVNVNGGVARKR